MSDDTPDWQPEDGAGYMPTEERTTETVPKEDLRALIKGWKERHDDEITMMEKAAWGTAIQELEELL